MNLNVITHIETVEHLYVPNISTAHHTPPLMRNILTEVIHHDVTNLHGLLHVIVLAVHSLVLKICFGPPTAESKNLKTHVNFDVGDLF